MQVQRKWDSPVKRKRLLALGEPEPSAGAMRVIRGLVADAYAQKRHEDVTIPGDALEAQKELGGAAETPKLAATASPTAGDAPELPEDASPQENRAP